MKNSLIIIAVLYLSFTHSIQAQTAALDTRENFTFGLKVGLNYSNIWDGNGQDFKTTAKVGFAGGAFLGIPLGKYLGLQPEVLISQKGVTGTGTILFSPYSFTRTTTYLDIPLQIQLKPSEFLTIVAGPQYSYLLNQKDTYTYGSNSSAQEQEFKNDNIRKNILAFVGGIDINIKHVVVSGRIGWDLQTNNGDGTSTTPRYKNQWLQLTIGFKI